MMDNTVYDLLIIGGGINGTGIASDASGRGLSTLLCEQGDLAQATSSASSKLIHGGLRYLEQYHFGLVRKALKERATLLHAAPHLISPLHFILPYTKKLRPAWLIRLGLFLYDTLAGKSSLSRSRKIYFSEKNFYNILKSSFNYGFEYSDCWVDDARLVIANALCAKEHGAVILPRTRVIQTKRLEQNWEVTVQNALTQQKMVYYSRVLVNAAGPWASEILNTVLNVKKYPPLALIKGSHIVVPRFYTGSQAYLLQHSDKRIVFVIPFEEKFTLIGTTDVPYKGDPLSARIDPEEIEYLCKLVNSYFQHSIKPSDIVFSYSGVRPLIDCGEKNASEISRDYQLVLDTPKNLAPLLDVFGGKITTYRQLSEEAVNLLKKVFPNLKPAWTSTTILPGGDVPDRNIPLFFADLKKRYSWMPDQTLKRFAKMYGTRTFLLLDGVSTIHEMGHCFGHDLYEKEVTFLINTEWALSAEDILWRRSKLGLFLSDGQKKNLSEWLLPCSII